MKWINRLYIFFIGIILSITTGFGIAAFYPQPISPQYSSTPKMYRPDPASCSTTPEASQTADCKRYFDEQDKQSTEDIKASQEYEKKMQVYANVNAGYTRTAIFFGIAFGALYAILGLAIIKKSSLIATGLLLSGVLTALFTRILINLASLGAAVSGTDATMVGYVEFIILLLLSLGVIAVGLFTLPEEAAKKSSK